MPLERLSTAPRPRTSRRARAARQARVAHAAATRASVGAPTVALARLRAPSTGSSAKREQPEQRERQHPRALVAEADAEQPQRARRAAEGDRIAFAPVRQELGPGGGWRAGALRCACARRGGCARAPRRRRSLARTARTRPADRNLSRGRRPGLRRVRSRCSRRSARARCCCRAADVRALGGGRQFDDGDPRERHGEHHEPRRAAAAPPARSVPGAQTQVAERDPGNDQVGGERLGVERQPDEHRAAQQRRQRPLSHARSAAPQASIISRISSGSTPLSRETATNDGNTASASAPASAGERAEPPREHQVEQRAPRARPRSPRAAAG